MKILQVSNFLAHVHGGSAEVPFQLSRALADKGYDVTIFTSDISLDAPVEIPRVNVNAFKTLVSTAGFTITPGMIKKASKEIGKFDIIHLHNYRTYQNIVAHHYARKYGIPYVLQAHGSLSTFFQKGLLKKIFDIIWGNTILKDARKAFATTEIEAEQYRNLRVRPEKIEIVPPGIDLDEFSGSIEKGVFRRRYKIGADPKIVLFLGRIHKMKGLDILAQAFTGLIRDKKNVVLVIAGPDDGYLSTLKKLVDSLGVKENIVFTGPLYGKEKLQAYTDADVFVLPSSYEIFGITILEAWACHKPVIVTDRCGLADAVKDGAGLVVSYDKEQLAKALTRIVDDNKLMLEMGKQGRKLVEERYNWAAVALQVENIYQDIIGKKTV
jgi:glycosyltransferase involved in cell wall biosynthesis